MEVPEVIIKFMQKNLPFKKIISYSNGYLTGKPEHYIKYECKEGTLRDFIVSDSTLASGSFPRYETIEAGSFERS